MADSAIARRESRAPGAAPGDRGARTRGPAPDRDACVRILESLADRFSGRTGVMQRMEDLYYSAYKIPLPKDVEAENPVYVYTFKAAQQIFQGEGILGDKKANVLYAATATRSDDAKARVELLQNHTNRAFDRLEQQSGQLVAMPCKQDLLKFGWSLECLEPDPRLLGRYSKSLKDFAEPDQYRKDRNRFITRMGQRGGRLPLIWRHVDALSSYWLEGAETGGLSLVAEKYERYVRDVLNDPRYTGSAATEWVWKQYTNHGTEDPKVAGGKTVTEWTIQDGDWTTKFLCPPDRFGSPPQGASPTVVYSSSNDLGEIAWQQRNPIGRPHYVLTKGLRTSSSDPAKALIGIFFFAESLIKILDTMLSVQACATTAQAFAPWLYIREQERLNNAQMLPGLPPTQQRRIEIARGNGFITEMDPGSIEQIISKAPPELQAFVAEIKEQQNLLLIPDSLTAASSNGYAYNSVRNTVLSRMKPIIEGLELAACQRADLYAEILAWLNETITLTTIQDDHEVQLYAFDPRAYAELEVTLDAKFTLPRPEDNMADLQAAAFAVQNRLMDVARARERYLGLAEHREIERDIALDDYRRSPKVAEFVITRAAEEAGMLLEQQAADQQGDVSVEQLLNTHPELLAALAQQAQPGDPGYAEIMHAAQLAGIVPPTPATADEAQAPTPAGAGVNALAPGAPPDQGPPLPPGAGGPPRLPIAPPGLPAGQRQALPGGPRRTGGVG